MSRGRAVRTAALGALVLLCAAACGGNQPARSTDAASPTGTVTVLAAASLKESFTAIAHDFEKAHPGTRVVLSFGPSSGLAQQIAQGAPADVFASASEKNMQQVVSAGDAAGGRTFARNQLEIAVPPDNPADVSALADLGRPGVKVAVCQRAVPCGALAAAVLDAAQVHLTPVTQEADVKAVLAKVQLGEVDAGLVYVTDVRAAGTKVRGVTIPADVNASTSYPIAVLRQAPNPTTATAFADFVLSAQGRRELAAAGFAAP